MASLIDGLLDDPRSPDLVATFNDPSGSYAGTAFLDLSPNDPFAFGVADL